MTGRVMNAETNRTNTLQGQYKFTATKRWIHLPAKNGTCWNLSLLPVIQLIGLV
uniref:Uncharacterized protein n=1 Tax=Arion vulgaris TaxID=1028688 RepID=A0A0B7BW53_9EUPU